MIQSTLRVKILSGQSGFSIGICSFERSSVGHRAAFADKSPNYLPLIGLAIIGRHILQPEIMSVPELPTAEAAAIVWRACAKAEAKVETEAENSDVRGAETRYLGR